MGNYAILNKLCYGKDLVGYRLDIFNSNNKLISIDCGAENMSMLKDALKGSEVKKGTVIKGTIVNDVFVTGATDNVIEVKNKNQLMPILNKYLFNSKSLKGVIESLDKVEYGAYKPVKLAYSMYKKACEGLKYDLYVDEYQDSSSGELVIVGHFLSIENALKVFFKFGKLKKFSNTDILVSKEQGYSKVTVDFSGGFDKFYSDVVKNNKDMPIEIDGGNTNCFISQDDVYIMQYSINIPGYNEEKYCENKEELLRSYDLI